MESESDSESDNIETIFTYFAQTYHSEDEFSEYNTSEDDEIPYEPNNQQDTLNTIDFNMNLAILSKITKEIDYPQYDIFDGRFFNKDILRTYCIELKSVVLFKEMTTKIFIKSSSLKTKLNACMKNIYIGIFNKIQIDSYGSLVKITSEYSDVGYNVTSCCRIQLKQILNVYSKDSVCDVIPVMDDNLNCPFFKLTGIQSLKCLNSIKSLRKVLSFDSKYLSYTSLNQTYLIQNIKSLLGPWEIESSKLPNHFDYSLDLLTMLPFSFKYKHKFFQCRSKIMRLYCLSKILSNKSFDFRCAYCDLTIAYDFNLIRITNVSPCHSFVNPYFKTFDLMTLTNTYSTMVHGQPDIRDTWFEGYYWQTLYCNFCSKHMGWKFTAKQPNLDYPPLFFAVILNQVLIRFTDQSEDSHTVDGVPELDILSEICKLLTIN